jgi:transketolase
MTDKISLRAAYGRYLAELGDKRDDFITVDADMCGATFVDIFRQKFPERHIRFGIAEQNMMCAAAGLATTGIIPIVNTMAVFAAMRALEMFRTSIAMPKFNVKVVASHQGIDVGNDGPTHQCIEDMAIMRAIPNTVVLSPADQSELQAMMRFMLDYNGPVYLRTGRSPVPGVHKKPYVFSLGCWPVIKNGTDLSIIANGVLVEKALAAAETLAADGISAQVLNASSIKPVNEEDLINKIAQTGAIVSVEDHTVLGGIGSIVADVLCKHKPLPLEKIGLQDCFGESGCPDELFNKYHIDAEAISHAAHKVLKRK